MDGEGPTIAFSAVQDGDRLKLVVSDTGPGVPDAARDALFSAFRGSVRPGGTGLGLAIASELVRAHGGEITLLADIGDDAATPGVALPGKSAKCSVAAPPSEDAGRGGETVSPIRLNGATFEIALPSCPPA